MNKQESRQELNSNVESFLANGGKIITLEPQKFTRKNTANGKQKMVSTGGQVPSYNPRSNFDMIPRKVKVFC